MSSICQSCGGVIGRDCFNPDECAWITESMQRESVMSEQRQMHYQHEAELHQLQERIEHLEESLQSVHTSIQQWKVSLLSPTPEDPFRRIDCKIVDVGYADKAIVVEAETSVDDED